MTAIVSLLLLCQVGPVAIAPEVARGPQPAPRADSWEIELEALAPRRIDVGGDSYWYVVYTAINRSTNTQRFFPTFQVVTDDLRVVSTEIGVSPAVFAAVRERHVGTHRFLTHPTAAIGDLLPGRDHARESVAIWRASQITGNAFSIFVGGLSGETRLVRNPAFDPAKPEAQRVMVGDVERDVEVNPRYFTIRKTLELRYLLRAGPGLRGMVSPELERERWVMR